MGCRSTVGPWFLAPMMGVRFPPPQPDLPAWWNGIHRRLKISRPCGLASSNLAAGTNLAKSGVIMLTKNSNLSTAFFVASLVSVAASIFVWVSAGADVAHAERFGIFVGLWAPTLMGLANYYRE